MEVSDQILLKLTEAIARLDGRSGGGMTVRKPDSSRVSGVNEVKDVSINGCIDFSIQNEGGVKVFYGFTEEYQDIELNAAEVANWPLYRPCEVWEGKVFIRFDGYSEVNVLKTV